MSAGDYIVTCTYARITESPSGNSESYSVIIVYVVITILSHAFILEFLNMKQCYQTRNTIEGYKAV